MTKISSALAAAEIALGKGEYRECLAILNPLSEEYPPTNLEGGRIKMLIVTALMGQGEDEKALAICRLLTRSEKATIRHEAKQLLSILEAPSLEKPDNWSVTIPNLSLDSLEGEKIIKGRGKKSATTSPDYPPTGPTKGLDLGFSTIAVVLIISAIIFFNR